ncbi:putative ATP-binding protein PRP16 [Fusarium bulbicola]|nr:putative ATP-binding protein PRP16 [Fusarium bulbicola]
MIENLNEKKKTQITTAQAIAIEDSKDHPFRPGEKLSEKYFELFKQRRALPVSPRRQEFLDAYHQPQPRRIAATSVAARTAKELDIQVGDEVGNLVRFDRKAHPWKTRLGYMTDGILTELAKPDPDFNLYAGIIAGESHERTLSRDTAGLTQSDHMALMIRKDIHDKKRDGDILIFFQSVEEVEEVCNLLRKEIVYVIDLGKSKQSDSNPRMGLESRLRGPISQAAARKRAGRIKPGFCYRLYTHKSFMEDMRPSNQLEILESDTASHVLRLKAMGFDDVARFDFIDRPHPELLF